MPSLPSPAVPAPAPACRQALAVLHDFARDLESTLPTDALRISVETGYLTELGLQHSLVATSPDDHFRDVVCRVYLPEAGFPAACDFYGESPEAAAGAEALRAALETFVAQAETRRRLQSLLALAAAG